MDIMQAVLLRIDKGLTFKQIEELSGIPDSTIHKKYHEVIHHFTKDKIEKWERNKGDILSGVEMMTVSQMMDNDVLKKASFNNLAYGLGVVNNINRLHRGQSTDNISVKALSASLSDLQVERERLRKQLEDDNG